MKTKFPPGRMMLILILFILNASLIMPHAAFLTVVPAFLLVTVSIFTWQIYAEGGRAEAVLYATGATVFVGVGCILLFL